MMLARLLLCVGLASIASCNEDRVVSSKESQNDEDPMIKGGHDAAKGAFPWQVMINCLDPKVCQMGNCSGSIINPHWILSAAHCFGHSASHMRLIVPLSTASLSKHNELYTWEGGTTNTDHGAIIQRTFTDKNTDPAIYKIVAGEHDISLEEGTEQVFDVQKIINHEGYQDGVGSHDVAVLKINGEFKFNQYVAPIMLATSEQNGIIEGNNKMHCITSGWGKLAFNASSPNILQALVMPLLPLRTCQIAYQWVHGMFNVTEDMLCSGYIQGDKSPCHGDSGGPLACMIESNWTLTGVVSWGKECGVPGYPGVFARVSYFHDWILEKVASD